MAEYEKPFFPAPPKAFEEGEVADVAMLQAKLDDMTRKVSSLILELNRYAFVTGDSAGLGVVTDDNGKIRADLVVATSIATDAVTTAKINASAVTAAKININGSIIVSNTGNIRQGKTTYNNATSGFYLGDSGTSSGHTPSVVNNTPIFHIGDATNYMYWNGSNLEINTTKGVLGADSGNLFNIASKVIKFTGDGYATQMYTDGIVSTGVVNPGSSAIFNAERIRIQSTIGEDTIQTEIKPNGITVTDPTHYTLYDITGMYNGSLRNVNVSSNARTVGGCLKYESNLLKLHNGTSYVTLLSTAVTVAETQGGTGATAYTQGDILYSDTSNSLSKLAIGSTGQICSIVSGIPAWTASPTYTVTGGFGGSATSPEGDHVVATGGTTIISFSVKTISGTSAIARNGISVSGTNPYIWGQGGSTNAAIDSDKVSVSGGTLTFKAGNTGINSNGESFVYSVTFTK